MSVLFVYGTLKRGQSAEYVLRTQEFSGRGAKFLCESLTAPHYRLFDVGKYPGLVADEADGYAIEGELWRVSDATLALLDAYEGAPILFRRGRVEMQGFDEPVEAYFYQRDVTGMPECGSCWPSNKTTT